MIKSVKGKSLSVETRRELAIELASLMISESRRVQSYSERVYQDQLARMMSDPEGIDFTTTVTDECFRSQSSKRVADQLAYIVKKIGVPHFLNFGKRLPLSLFKVMGSKMAALAVPIAKKMIRNEASKVILPAERDRLKKYLAHNKAEGVRVNINHLGEAILGEKEALKRLDMYLDDLSRPEIDYISIKISTICSQLNLLAREQTVGVLAERLRQLYRAANKHQYEKDDGTLSPKFVNLDMEEYRDLELTVAVFQKVLDEPEFYHTSAGIVLQAYLPDAYLFQQQLTLWALKRVASGGAPIKIRLVKGANLAMEQLEARLRGWPQAPYVHKVDVDANFKRMVGYACQPEHAKAVHIGIGSHNLFDVAYALLLREENGVGDTVKFEMLEGMANHIRRVVLQISGEMLNYCPIAYEHEFQHAVAYLVRRLDENTSPENFLHHAFSLIPGTRDWQQQASLFSLSCHAANTVSFKLRRTQNRLVDPPRFEHRKDFRNEPDTDWSLLHNGKWAEGILKEWHGKDPISVPIVVGGEGVLPSSQNDVASRPVKDPSRPDYRVAEMSQASQKMADVALNTALMEEATWGDVSPQERSERLAEAANIFRSKRSDLIGAMALSGGKLVTEADIEVSEAIDFIEYYRRSLLEWMSAPGLSWKPKGATLILPPWNFPCAIPTGGIAAALAAGNPVIFKPAPEAALIGWELVNIFWEAGISKKVLQFVPCKDETVGSYMVGDPRIKKVILTGSTYTAKSLMTLKPGLDLCAETGGKNSLIATALADRDLVIRDTIHSAFSHSGQKCSACSLLILEKEVYEDRHFLENLADAASSLKVGSAWDLGARINPLIAPPSDPLLWALTSLEEGEEWLLKPEQDPSNPALWSPGIKVGVRPGSRSHLTEFFGPVLSVMKADNLDEAISLANQVPYGLTAGIHSLDEREHAYWLERIEAGNCYINRGITGAIVQRQPFGGFKQSSFGSGIKTGGPNYLLTFMTPEQTELPKEPETIPEEAKPYLDLLSEEEKKVFTASVGDYVKALDKYFSLEHDWAGILGQDNILRYLPRKQVTLRVQSSDRMVDIARAVVAAQLCQTPLVVSSETERTLPGAEVIVETDDELARRLSSLEEKAVRLLSAPSETLYEAIADQGVSFLRHPVTASGRLELMNVLREQSISYDYHRYGNIAYKDVGKRNPQS